MIRPTMSSGMCFRTDSRAVVFRRAAVLRRVDQVARRARESKSRRRRATRAFDCRGASRCRHCTPVVRIPRRAVREREFEWSTEIRPFTLNPVLRDGRRSHDPLASADRARESIAGPAANDESIDPLAVQFVAVAVRPSMVSSRFVRGTFEFAAVAFIHRANRRPPAVSTGGRVRRHGSESDGRISSESREHRARSPNLRFRDEIDGDRSPGSVHGTHRIASNHIPLLGFPRSPGQSSLEFVRGAARVSGRNRLSRQQRQ